MKENTTNIHVSLAGLKEGNAIYRKESGVLIVTKITDTEIEAVKPGSTQVEKVPFESLWGKKAESFNFSYDEMLDFCYKLYQEDWLKSHVTDEDIKKAYNIFYEEKDDYATFQDFLWERGFNGAIYACKDEFENEEFTDVEYIRTLLEPELFTIYRVRCANEWHDVRAFARTSDNPSGKLPVRSTENSAGYDFFAKEDVIIPAGKFVHIETGVKAYMPDNEVLIMANRSSNPTKKNLVLINGIGVVDADYADNPENEGNIGFVFLNAGSEDVTIKTGDKLGQGLFVNYKITDDDNASGKRVGGFGSTGK